MKICLMRHGQPTVDLTGSARAGELSQLAGRYDESGIKDSPPKRALEAVVDYPCVITSTLRRSIESALALGVDKIHIQDSLFREAEIPHFSKGAIKLPLGFWLPVLRVLWLFGFSQNGESLRNSLDRARRAAQQLVELAEQHGEVLLVGHGFLNHFIARELVKRGWTGPKKPASEYWDHSLYQMN